MANQNSLRKRLGGTGTQLYRGIITAEEYNPSLTRGQAIAAYDTMFRSDTTIQSIIKLVKLPIMGLHWDIEAASEDEQDQFRADFVRAQLFNGKLNWFNFMDEAFEFLPIGYAVAEKTYEPCLFDNHELLGLQEIIFLKQKSIQKWETNDGQPGVEQLLHNATTSSASIPMEKLIVFTHQKRGDNYEGISLLRSAYADWYMKDKLRLLLGVGLEKAAIPTPILEVPKDAGQNEVDDAVEIIRNMRANEEGYIKKPAGWGIEKLDMSGQSTDQILPAIKYFDRQMQMAVLAPFMGLGAGDASGSRAVGDIQYKPYVLQEEAIAREFAQAVQEQLIKQLCDLNFSDLPNGYPKLVHSKLTEDDLTTLSSYVQNIKTAGLLTATFDTEQHLRKVAGLPELPDEAEAAYEEQQEVANGGDSDANDEQKEEADTPTKKDVKATALAELRQARKIAVKILDED